MTQNILILGAGFGGLEAAKYLSENLDSPHEITLIDQKDYFIIGDAKFDVMFGRHSADEVKESYDRLAIEDIEFVQTTVTELDIADHVVQTESGEFPFDYLIVGLGTELALDATPGFAESGYSFYSLAGAEKLRPVIEDFDAGRILIAILGTPYQCPPAPYEAAFQLDDFYSGRGHRGDIGISVLTPAPQPIPPSDHVSAELERRMAAKDIDFLPNTHVVALDSDRNRAELERGGAIGYDLCIGIPVHRPPRVVRDSVLSRDGTWISVDPQTLQTQFENVYAIGDVTEIPAGEWAVPKAGTFAQDAAQEAAKAILHDIGERTHPATFEGLGSCYVDFGAGEVGELDVNFLGGDQPVMDLRGPSTELRQDKRNFEQEMLERWFQ